MEKNLEVYETPEINDVQDAAEVTKGEGGSSHEEQIIWGEFSAPLELLGEHEEE